VPRSSAASTARRVLRWFARLIGLAIVVVLVVGIGLGIRGTEPEEPSYSASEQAQLDAEERFRTLSDDARALATVRPDAAEELTRLAADLEVQAAAVALPRSPASAVAEHPGDGTTSEPDSAANAATAGPTAAGAPPVDGPGMVSLLRESALWSLRHAVDADPGPARVLASAGTNQWRHAVLLGEVLDADPGLPPPASLPLVEDVDGQGGHEECSGTAFGPDADRRSLLDAKQSEDRAHYGYEVAAALVEDRAGALERAAQHRAAAESAAQHLAALCDPAPPAPAGFLLDGSFRADPSEALRQLEQDHVELYADLVSMVGPETRAWAVVALNAAVQRSMDTGAGLTALPGLGEDAPAEPGPAAPERS
jgi:hypothetical protein